MSITYATIGLTTYFFVIRLGIRWAFTNPLLIYPTIDISLRLVMAVWCHLYCLLGDPGRVPAGTPPKTDRSVSDADRVRQNGHKKSNHERTASLGDDSEIRKARGSDVCKKCYAIRPARTHHCSTCGCVERMDHHCPWINNCVGIKNQKAFILFLAYTCSAAVECVALAAVRAITCPSISHSVLMLGLRMVMGESKVNALLDRATDKAELPPFEPTCELNIEYALSGAIAIVLAIVFIIFIAFIASDQIQSIIFNQTHIEHLKGERGGVRTMRQAAIETFGCEPSLWWLLPIDWRWRQPAAPVLTEVQKLKGE